MLWLTFTRPRGDQENRLGPNILRGMACGEGLRGVHRTRRQFTAGTVAQAELEIVSSGNQAPAIGAVYPAPMPTFCTVWKSLPSVLMLGAMMISVS